MEYKIPAGVIVVAILIIIAAGITAFSRQEIPDTTLTVHSGTITPADLPVTKITTKTIPVTPRPTTLKVSEKEAISLLREEYNFWDYALARISLTDRYPGKALYECSMVPGRSGFYRENATFFIDAITGDFYFPSQEGAGITIDQAKSYVRQAFPDGMVDRIRIRFSDGLKTPYGWNFRLMKNNETFADGLLDADTGELIRYSMYIPWSERADASPVTMDIARDTADAEIRKRNGEISLKLTESRYTPLLGMSWAKTSRNYVFVYSRIIRGVPCESDGIAVTVHSITGDVIGYRKTWDIQETAVAPLSAPKISSHSAADLVGREGRARYPESADSLTIISADLRWMDTHNADTIDTAPGSIPLAWKVTFDDATIRAQQYPNPGVGWVDAGNGSLLEMDYRH